MCSYVLLEVHSCKHETRVKSHPGEYIHHYCPNRTTADVDDENIITDRSRPASLVPQKDFDGTPRGWPWVVLSLLLTLVLAMAGFVTCQNVCAPIKKLKLFLVNILNVLSRNLLLWVEEF